jgi:hypothetical protein
MKRTLLFFMLIILALSMVGCATPTPQVIQQTVIVEQTVVVQQTVVVPQVTVITKEIVVTPTPPPAVTPEPEATVDAAVSQTTPVKDAGMVGSSDLSLYQDPVLKAWCNTVKTTASTANAWEMPADAVPALDNKGRPQLNMPSTSCTLVFTFDQALPKDAQLMVYDIYNTPWLKLMLQPVDGNANMGYVILKHESIIDPPLWETKAQYEVKSGDQSLWAKEIIFFDRNIPNWRCVSNNAPPRKDTGRCDSQIELHPWDAGWGTPGPDGWGHN